MLTTLDRHCVFGVSACAGRAMDKQETGYDHNRYKQLLAEAVDETRRLELIEIMIRERARERLEAQRTADRIAMELTDAERAELLRLIQSEIKTGA